MSGYTAKKMAKKRGIHNQIRHTTLFPKKILKKIFKIENVTLWRNKKKRKVNVRLDDDDIDDEDKQIFILFIFSLKNIFFLLQKNATGGDRFCEIWCLFLYIFFSRNKNCIYICMYKAEKVYNNTWYNFTRACVFFKNLFRKIRSFLWFWIWKKIWVISQQNIITHKHNL